MNSPRRAGLARVSVTQVVLRRWVGEASGVAPRRSPGARPKAALHNRYTASAAVAGMRARGHGALQMLQPKATSPSAIQGVKCKL